MDKIDLLGLPNMAIPKTRFEDDPSNVGKTVGLDDFFKVEEDD